MNSSVRSAQSRPKITFNAPAVLGFALVCLAALILDRMTGGAANDYVFSVYRWPLYRPMAWVRLICHIFGHAGWDHLLGNMMYILILGPMLEEKYGTWNVIFVMLATAAVTGLVHMAFFPGLALCGASGVVFAFILLSSITDIREGEIPLTFILVAVLYIGQQVYQCFFYKDNISQFTHILGGGVGAALGFFMNNKGLTRYSAQR